MTPTAPTAEGAQDAPLSFKAALAGFFASTTALSGVMLLFAAI